MIPKVPALVPLFVLFLAAFVMRLKPSFISENVYRNPLLYCVAAFLFVFAYIFLRMQPITKYIVDKDREEVDTYVGKLKKIYFSNSALVSTAIFSLASIFILVIEGMYGDFYTDLGIVKYPLDKVMLFLILCNAITVLAENSDLYDKWFKGFKAPNRRRKK